MQHTENVVDVTRLLGNPKRNDAADAILSVKYGPDGQWCACASTDGEVHMFHNTHGMHSFMPVPPTELGVSSDNTLTSAKWSPTFGTEGTDFMGTMATTTTNGTVQLWGVLPSKRHYEVRVSVREKLVTEVGAPSVEFVQPTHANLSSKGYNHTMSCAFSTDGKLLVTGGSDALPRLYQVTDQMGLTHQHTYEKVLDNRGQDKLCHNSKIMSIKFLNPHVFISAGWETSVLLWDTRQGKCASSLLEGPRIGGEGLDIAGSVVACASDRAKVPLQLFDLTAGKLDDTIINASSNFQTRSSLFAVKLIGRQGKLAAWIAGHQPNEISLVSLRGGLGLDVNESRKPPTIVSRDVASPQLASGPIEIPPEVASVTGFEKPIYALDICPTYPDHVICGGPHNYAFRLTTQVFDTGASSNPSSPA